MLFCVSCTTRIRCFRSDQSVNDVKSVSAYLLAMFLAVDRVNYIAVYGRVRELSECIINILICVLKMNGGRTGLKQHEGE